MDFFAGGILLMGIFPGGLFSGIHVLVVPSLCIVSNIKRS